MDEELWQEVRESFEDWTLEIFQEATRSLLRDFRTYLVSHGVWVKKQAGGASYAKVLYETATEKEQHVWTEEEIKEQIMSTEGLSSNKLIVREQSPIGLRHPSIDPIVLTPPTRDDSRDTRTIANVREESVIPPSQPYRQFNTPDHPAVRILSRSIPRSQNDDHANRTISPHDTSRDPVRPMNAQEIASYESRPPTSKLLADLMKIYNQDERKYGGEEYDILDIKLQVFYDCCTKVGLPTDQFHLAFSIMLKGRASSFYYDKISGRQLKFKEMVDMTKVHFETEERRQKYLTEWRSMTLHRTMILNPDKSQAECLEILFDSLRTTQRGLSIEYQHKHNLRDQVINACQGIPECRAALFRTSPTFEGICAELRSTIGQASREKELQTTTFYQDDQAIYEPQEQYWTDRTYQGRGRYPARTASRGSFRPRSGFHGNPQAVRSRGKFRTTDTSQKKCYVCKKPGCWSTNHTDEERKKAYEGFVSEFQPSDEEFKSFLQEFEGEGEAFLYQYDKEADQGKEGVDPDIFLTELGPINGIRTIIALDDCSSNHVMTREDDTSHYIVTTAFTLDGRYSSEIFQGIIPDSGTSGVSTAGEQQVEAFQRLYPDLQIDRTKGREQEIRFGKGTTTT